MKNRNRSISPANDSSTKQMITFIKYNACKPDGAGWHTEDIVGDINTDSIIKLPTYSPELNAIEQVWNRMRQHHLAKQALLNYEAIVDKVSHAWNCFLESKDRVQKICSRSWHEIIS